MDHKIAQILLVEDNPGDIVLARAAFEKSRILNELHVVTDGQQALDFLFKENGFEDAVTPDLVLLDINLPKIDGLEVLKRVKASEKTKRIPVIMLTGSNRATDIDKSYARYANSYITKPAGLTELSEVFDTLEDFWFVVVTRPTT